MIRPLALLAISAFLAACQTTIYTLPHSEVTNSGPKGRYITDHMYMSQHGWKLDDKKIMQARRQIYLANGMLMSDGSDQMNFAAIKSFNSRMTNGLSYRWENYVNERWDSKVDDFLMGKSVKGDCDELATTAMELAVIAGVPRERVLRILATTQGGMHMTAGYIDDAGEIWVFGDTFSPQMQKLRHTPHRILAYSRSSEEGNWRPYYMEKYAVVINN